ncbi:MAG: TetR/AcrR family transcriptional regulator, partial [Halieaceae bacterium]|nr:TetR/AcrR family transcriptional regulator [Halieaceae bacterium]
EPKRSRTRRRILGAARDLFLADGYSDTTMDAIAAAADISRASLFNYFPSKADLLDALGGDLESRLLRALTHYRDKHAGAPEVLNALFGRLAEVLEQTALLTRMLFLQAGKDGDLPQLRSELAALVADAQAAGSWREDVPATDAAEMIYLALVASLLGWRQDADTGAVQQRARLLNQLFSPGTQRAPG